MKPRFNVSRRAFLGGAGVLLALPALDSLVGRSASAEEAVAKRILTFYVPCGIHMATWTPALTGAGYKLSPTLASLAKVQNATTMRSYLEQIDTETKDRAGKTLDF